MKHKSLSFGFLLILYLVGLCYLAIPTPSVPDLSGATKSDEPGDTWQNPNTKAFFTDMTRTEVISFYRDNYHLSLLGVEIPSVRFNYPPEDTGTYIRKHIDTNFLEEIVHPFRESVFIGGWTPSEAPRFADLPPEQRAEHTIVINNKTYFSKITIRWYESTLASRLLVWTLTIPTIWLAFRQFKLSLKTLGQAIFKG